MSFPREDKQSAVKVDLTTLHSLDAIVAPTQFKSYAELQARFNLATRPAAALYVDMDE